MSEATEQLNSVRKLVTVFEDLVFQDLPTAKVLRWVLEERDYQIRKWSAEHDQKHSLVEWTAILTTYLGKAVMETPLYGRNPKSFRKRIVQLAAICLAILESTEDLNGNSGQEG